MRIGMIRRLASGLMIITTVLGLAAQGRAEDESVQQTDAQAADALPSGIVGYEPMTNSDVQALMHGTQPSEAPAAAIIGQTAPKVNPNLPLSYETGIVGEGPYTLGRDDVIRIDVLSQPEFSGSYAVGFDGRIQYGMVGDLPVAGLTKQEVQQLIAQHLMKYVRTPTVVVTITAYNSKAIYVMGEVNAPGKYIMRGDVIKLREAIIAAGLPTRTAAIRRIVVVKPDMEHPVVRKINFHPILVKGRLEHDIDLYPGEIVYVPETVLSKFGRFLGNLLSPTHKATSAASRARRL